MDRSDSDECDTGDDSGDATPISYASGWGDEPPASTLFGGGGWGSTTPDPTWEPPAEKGLSRTFCFFSDFVLVLAETYPSLQQLLNDFNDPPCVRTLFDHLDKVQKLTWGDFLHSKFFEEWLLGFCRGDIEAGDSDYDMANVFLDRLPGFEDSGSNSGRGWSVMEELYPGRFINMKTLKTEIMQVRIHLEKY